MTGMKGVAFYLFVYGFMTIGAFAVRDRACSGRELSATNSTI